MFKVSRAAALLISFYVTSAAAARFDTMASASVARASRVVVVHRLDAEKNRALVVGIATVATKASPAEVTTVTYEGQRLVALGDPVRVGGSSTLSLRLFVLPESRLPVAGLHALVVEWGAPVVDAEVSVLSVSGVGGTPRVLARGDSSGRDVIQLANVGRGLAVDVVASGKAGTFRAANAATRVRSERSRTAMSLAVSTTELSAAGVLGYRHSGANRLAMAAVIFDDATSGAGTVAGPAPAPTPTPAPVPPPVVVPPVNSSPGPTACSDLPAAGELVGWAAVEGLGLTSTTGGAGGLTVTVKTFAELTAAVADATPRTVRIVNLIEGSVEIGSNKTIVGGCGGTFKGHLNLKRSANVIVRDLKIIGFNCADRPDNCSGGADAITVTGGSHHLWFDHDDVSDGSDGNLDITHASDFITVSWTKFSYSGRRRDPGGARGGHQFSNLIGHSDGNAGEDTGHLRVTFDHVWWADNVMERAPRVRFGQVHVLNSLYTSRDGFYAIGVGFGANILAEGNVFDGTTTPINVTSYSDARSLIRSIGNVYLGTLGARPVDLGGPAFRPPYRYQVEPTAGLEDRVRAGIGPR